MVVLGVGYRANGLRFFRAALLPSELPEEKSMEPFRKR